MEKQALSVLLQKYPKAQRSLIPALQKAQEFLGYLAPETLEEVASVLNIPLSRVYGVATFYSQFHLEPRGRHTIKVCVGTACHVRGADGLLQALEEKLGIKAGRPTPDMQFQLETVACLGTCFLAPAVMIDGDYYGAQTPQSIVKVLKKYSQDCDSDDDGAKEN